jgi:hypothetical protein
MPQAFQATQHPQAALCKTRFARHRCPQSPLSVFLRQRLHRRKPQPMELELTLLLRSGWQERHSTVTCRGALHSLSTS